MKDISILRPQIALIIFIIVLMVYIIILDKEGAFQNKFLHFGPSPDTTFLNIPLTDWKRVISIYCIALFSSISLSYYQNVASYYVANVLLHPAYTKTIKDSRLLSQFLVIIDPIIISIVTIINFFITLTMEFQFIFFQIVGALVVTIPSNLINISKKKFLYF